ncbi:MAG: globin [Candidatus Thiodiazotropha sp. (ex Gloverina cf. vestifex)]|nr:globin [Candidatus Thiodiazotropha sp. (ex Gloverina cf. vestifex)]
MEQRDLNLFRESLARVTASDDFFDSFYDHFMAQSEEIAGFFHRQDMAQLKHKLEETLQMVADTAEGRPGLELYMEMLGRIHQRLHVERRHFSMWQTALIETVAVFDDHYNDQVEAAWFRVIASVIEIVFSALSQPHQQAS